MWCLEPIVPVTQEAERRGPLESRSLKLAWATYWDSILYLKKKKEKKEINKLEGRAGENSRKEEQKGKCNIRIKVITRWYFNSHSQISKFLIPSIFFLLHSYTNYIKDIQNSPVKFFLNETTYVLWGKGRVSFYSS